MDQTIILILHILDFFQNCQYYLLFINLHYNKQNFPLNYVLTIWLVSMLWTIYRAKAFWKKMIASWTVFLSFRCKIICWCRTWGSRWLPGKWNISSYGWSWRSWSFYWIWCLPLDSTLRSFRWRFFHQFAS